MMGQYGMPMAYDSAEPEMLRPNNPTYSLPVPSAGRHTADQFAGWPAEAPAAMSQAPQIGGRSIGNIGHHAGGSGVGKVSSSSAIGGIGQAGTPNIGRVSVGHIGGPSSRGIGQVGSSSIGHAGSGSGIGQVGGPQIGHAGSGIGQVGGPSIGQTGSGIGQVGGPSIGHTGSGMGQVGGPSIGHKGAGIGQIGATNTDLALARPMGHLPHSLSAKQQAMMGYPGSVNPMSNHIMGWGLASQQQHGMYGALGSQPANPYGQGIGGMQGMYGYAGAPNMMSAPMQMPSLPPSRPGSIHTPSGSAFPESHPNHVSIHSVPDSSTGTEIGLDKLTSAASLASQVSNVRGPKVCMSTCIMAVTLACKCSSMSFQIFLLRPIPQLVLYR